MRYCKDCKHCRASWIDPFHYNFATCSLFDHKQEEYVDLVSGEKKFREVKSNSCSDLRKDLAQCGPNGRYFEEKN